jgi:hypothetical protein
MLERLVKSGSCGLRPNTFAPPDMGFASSIDEPALDCLQTATNCSQLSSEALLFCKFSSPLTCFDRTDTSFKVCVRDLQLAARCQP